MRRSAIKNFLNTLGYDLVCIYPLQLISAVVIARYLGVELKGVQTFIGLCITIILPLTFFGYGSGLKYFLTKKRISIRDTGFLSHIITLIVCTIFALFILILWKFESLGPSGNKLTQTNIFFIIIAIYLSGIAYITNRILLGLSLFIENNRLNAIYQICLTLALLISINVKGFDINMYLVCYIFSKIIFLLGGLKLLYYKKKYKFISSYNDLKLIMSYGKKSWPNELTNVFNTRIDQIIIAFIIPSELLGIYSVAVIISEVSSRIPQSVSLIFFNKIAGYKDKKSQVRLMLIVNKFSFYSTFISSIVSIVISYYLIEKLFGSDFKNAFTIMVLYLPGVVLFNSLRVFFQYFSAIGTPQATTIILIKSLILIVPTIFILTSNYSVYGAAAASSIGYLITFIFAIKYLNKSMKIKFSDFLLSKNDFTWLKDQIISLKQK